MDRQRRKQDLRKHSGLNDDEHTDTAAGRGVIHKYLPHYGFLPPRTSVKSQPSLLSIPQEFTKFLRETTFFVQRKDTYLAKESFFLQLRPADLMLLFRPLFNQGVCNIYTKFCLGSADI